MNAETLRNVTDQTKKVSVIIPMKNDGIYALKLLKTLKKDPYENLEIIFIDDGSKDDSVEKLKDYILNEKLKNVKLFREDAGGLAAAKNVGIEKSTGDYLIFLDPRDEPTQSFITALMLTIKNGEQTLALTGIREKSGVEEGRVLYKTLTITRRSQETTKFYCERVFKKDDRLSRLNNKLFNADIIKAHNLKFEKIKATDKDKNDDKKLSDKGESLERQNVSERASNLKFIKKYIKVGEIENFVTINKPLITTQKT